MWPFSRRPALRCPVRLAPDAAAAWSAALRAARHERSSCLSTAHLLLGLVGADGTMAAELARAGVTADAIRAARTGLDPPLPDDPPYPSAHTPRLQYCLQAAEAEARSRGDDAADPSDLLLALRREPDGIAAELLARIAAGGPEVG